MLRFCEFLRENNTNNACYGGFASKYENSGFELASILFRLYT
jgi:hypothetical protein